MGAAGMFCTDPVIREFPFVRGWFSRGGDSICLCVKGMEPFAIINQTLFNALLVKECQLMDPPAIIGISILALWNLVCFWPMPCTDLHCAFTKNCLDLDCTAWILLRLSPFVIFCDHHSMRCFGNAWDYISGGWKLVRTNCTVWPAKSCLAAILHANT